MSYKPLLNNKKIFMIIICFLLLIGTNTDINAQDDIIGVASRGHIENIGDYPVDGSWLESPEIIGTVGQSKRIEGFEIKLDGTVPDGLEIRYNVHVQNKSWLYDETDSTQWPKNGEYAGTRGEGLRIEAVKIVLVDSTGNLSSAYSVAYRGHVQNIGNLPLSNDDWYSDGQQLGTVGSSLRLEALQVKIVKTQSALTSYQEMLNKIQALHQADYTPSSWNSLQDALNSNQIDSNNSESEINQAFLAIQSAANALVIKGALVTYNEPGIFSANSDNQKIESDVAIAADGVTLENIIIDGDLTIDESVGSGTATLNNIVVLGDTYIRGGGPNSIHINGGHYSRIVMERTPAGQVRIVATDVNGLRIVISEDAAGETVILEGEFDSVIVDAPGMKVRSQGNTTIVSMVVTENGKGSSFNFDTQAKIKNLDLMGQADLRGQGTVENLDVAANNVTYERLPNYQNVEDNVEIPPVLVNQPNNGGGGGGGYSPPAPIEVTGVSLNSVSLDLIYQETAALTATVEPAAATNKGVSWSSSDDTIANVDADGKVTAVHAGTATITATTVDGNKIATCAVTVHGKLSIYQKSYFLAGSPYNSVVLDIEGDTIGAVDVQVGDSGLTSTQSVMNGRFVVEFNNEAKPGTITLKGIQTGSGIDSSMVNITVLTPTDSLALTDYSGTTSTFSFTAQTGASLILLQKKAENDADWDIAMISPASLNENSTSVSAIGLSADTVYTFRLLVYGGETPGASNVVTIQPVLGVTLNKTATTLSVGETETLTATFNPTNASSHAYSWSSDNASIASVDANGLVTANQPGTANIIATTAAGSKTASCTVTVEAVPVAVTGVSIDQESLDLVYQETADLTATVEPNNATNQAVSWSSSDANIATVENGTVTAVHAGTATITVISADGNLTDTCEVTVHGKLSLYAVSSFAVGTTSNYVTLYLEGDSFGSVYFDPGTTGLTCYPNTYDAIHYNADFFNEVKPGSLILKGINTASGIDTSIVTITVN